jgi:hypothetical protein
MPSLCCGDVCRWWMAPILISIVRVRLPCYALFREMLVWKPCATGSLTASFAKWSAISCPWMPLWLGSIGGGSSSGDALWRPAQYAASVHLAVPSRESTSTLGEGLLGSVGAKRNAEGTPRTVTDFLHYLPFVPPSQLQVRRLPNPSGNLLSIEF